MTSMQSAAADFKTKTVNYLLIDSVTQIQPESFTDVKLWKQSQQQTWVHSLNFHCYFEKPQLNSESLFVTYVLKDKSTTHPALLLQAAGCSVIKKIQTIKSENCFCVEV